MSQEMRQPIFILGAHKSGTSLLRSLFDGHPKIFVVPIEAHFFQLLRRWISYPFLKQHRPRQISKSEFIQNAIGAIRYSNQEANPMADGVSAGLFNIEKFVSFLEEELCDVSEPRKSLLTCFLAYSKAIHFSLYGTQLDTSKHILEKSVENAEYALDLKKIFPEASFIHILRNPYSNLVSMRKFRMNNKGSRNFPWLGYDYRSLYNSCYFLYRNQRLIPNYHVIQYEKLVKHPQTVIQSLCEYIGIDFHDSMLSPTYCGQQWSGNSTSSTQFKGISSANLERYKSNITSMEISLINKYLKHVIEDFGYEVLEPSSALLPAGRELPKEYIANRFLLTVG